MFSLTQSKADDSCAMYFDLTESCSDLIEFDSRTKPTATPIFRPQRIRKNHFQVRETAP